DACDCAEVAEAAARSEESHRRAAVLQPVETRSLRNIALQRTNAVRVHVIDRLRAYSCLVQCRPRRSAQPLAAGGRAPGAAESDYFDVGSGRSAGGAF